MEFLRTLDGLVRISEIKGIEPRLHEGRWFVAARTPIGDVYHVAECCDEADAWAGCLKLAETLQITIFDF